MVGKPQLTAFRIKMHLAHMISSYTKKSHKSYFVLYNVQK